MNMRREFVLWVLKIPGLRKVLLLPVFFYLQQKLGLDVISQVSRDQDSGVMLREMKQKLLERRRLLNFQMLALCRRLAGDGVMTPEELRDVEKRLGVENLTQCVVFLSGWGEIKPQLWGVTTVHTYRRDGDGVEKTATETRKSPLPWVSNPKFLEERPQYQEAVRSLRCETNTVEFYGLLYNRIMY